MTRERRLIVDLDDITAIVLQCGHCRSQTVVPMNTKIAGDLSCGACQNRFTCLRKSQADLINALHACLILQAQGEDQYMPTLKLQFNDPDYAVRSAYER